MRKFLIRSGLVLLFGAVMPFAGGWVINYGWPWQEQQRYGYYGSTGQAPDPAAHEAAVVQVYAARAARWRGIFGVHSWIAYKPANADRLCAHRGHRLGRAVQANRRRQAQWRSGSVLVGQGAGSVIRSARRSLPRRAIAAIEAAVERYPYANRYRVWPGPNSNTFTAHVLREVPELEVDSAADRDRQGVR